MTDARELPPAGLRGNALVQAGCRLPKVLAARRDLLRRECSGYAGSTYPARLKPVAPQFNSCEASPHPGSQGGYRFSRAAVAAWGRGTFGEIESAGMSGILPFDPSLTAAVPVACGPSDRRPDPQGTEDGQRYEQDQYASRKSDEKIAVGVVHRVVAEYVPTEQGKDGNASGCKKSKKG